MYVIVTDKIWSDKLAYLIWQPDEWTDGWTWTLKDYVDVDSQFNAGRHRYAFHRKDDAWRAIRNLRLRTGYVIKWDLDH